MRFVLMKPTHHLQVLEHHRVRAELAEALVDVNASKKAYVEPIYIYMCVYVFAHEDIDTHKHTHAKAYGSKRQDKRRPDKPRQDRSLFLRC